MDKYLLHCEFAQNELEVWNKSLCDYLSVSQNNFKFLSASGNSGLSAWKSYSRHLVILRWTPKPPSRTEMDALPAREDSGKGVYRKMVMVNMYGKPGKHGRLRGFGTCWTWMALVRLQGIAFPVPHGWSRCRVPLQNMRSPSPIGSGGGDPYRMVRIQCQSGVRIKIPESGFKNPDLVAFPSSLVWFVDPDRVRIRNHLHFLFWWIFYGSGPKDPDPGSRHTQ